MQDQIDLEAELSTPDLSARDLRDLAGLSYRQVNQWDERDFLPHQRAGSKGWRRVSGWDAIAVTIMASLRDRLGVSLQKQRGLFQWMTGRAQTIEDVLRIGQAEDMACELPSDGWAAGQGGDFMERFLEISMGGVSGVEAVPQIQELLRIAAHAPDAKALHAVQLLATGAFPLFGALGMMTAGFPVVLTTDLEAHHFMTELDFVERAREGRLPEAKLVLEVNGPINAVLGQKKISPLPIRFRASDVVPATEVKVEDSERSVMNMIAKRDFDRMIIEPKGGGYRIEVERNLNADEAADIARMINSNDYQSITVVRHDGKVVRLQQTVSILVPRADDGKTPTRAGRGKGQ